MVKVRPSYQKRRREIYNIIDQLIPPILELEYHHMDIISQDRWVVKERGLFKKPVVEFVLEYYPKMAMRIELATEEVPSWVQKAAEVLETMNEFEVEIRPK